MKRLICIAALIMYQNAIADEQTSYMKVMKAVCKGDSRCESVYRITISAAYSQGNTAGMCVVGDYYKTHPECYKYNVGETDIEKFVYENK